jgi:hypothetical protein
MKHPIEFEQEEDGLWLSSHTATASHVGAVSLAECCPGW